MVTGVRGNCPDPATCLLFDGVARSVRHRMDVPRRMPPRITDSAEMRIAV